MRLILHFFCALVFTSKSTTYLDYNHVFKWLSNYLKHTLYPWGNVAIILPYIISFAVGFSVSDETCAGLIQVLAALRALQAGCVPLQVRGDSQYVLVMDLASTSYTHGESLLLCRDQSTEVTHTKPAALFKKKKICCCIYWSLQYSCVSSSKPDSFGAAVNWCFADRTMVGVM